MRPMARRLGGGLALLAALAGGACTHERTGPVESHYLDFRTPKPEGNTVTVCHAYGCQKQSRVRFKDGDIAELRKLMAKTRKSDTPAEERRAVAYAIGWMETHIGRIIGTSADRPGMEFAGSGDPSQQDCVDEATNTTSYLLVLQHNGLIKHHTVGTPFAKENLLRGIAGWPHWTAILRENTNGQRWAVDSWIFANGENPAIVEAENWYISDLNNLPPSTR